MGRCEFRKPDRLRRIAFATALTPSGWPTTLSERIFSIRNNFSFSVLISLVTGMPVHLATISAIWSGVTVSAPLSPEAICCSFFASS